MPNPKTHRATIDFPNDIWDELIRLRGKPPHQTSYRYLIVEAVREKITKERRKQARTARAALKT